MSHKRSVLDRCELYGPAPKLSGQASYGGVLRSVFFLGGASFAASVFLASVLAVVLNLMGHAFWWVWLTVPCVTFPLSMWALGWTARRRDILVILWESLKLERAERKAK